MNYKYPTAALTTCPVKSLFLHNIVFQHDTEFDIIFEKSLRKLMFQLNGWSETDKNHSHERNPHIIDKILYVQVQSPWQEMQKTEEKATFKQTSSSLCET